MADRRRSSIFSNLKPRPRLTRTKKFVGTVKERHPDYPDLTVEECPKTPLTYRFAEHVLGVNPSEPTVEIPPEYTVNFSKSGHPFLTSQKSFYIPRKDPQSDGCKDQPDGAERPATSTECPEGGDQPAHWRNLPMSCTKDEIGDTYGVGIWIYFDFVGFLVLSNFFLLCIAMVHFVAHLFIDKYSPTLSHFWYNGYIVSYSKDTYNYWLWAGVAATALWFFFGPIYSMRVLKYYRQNQIVDLDDHLKKMDDRIQENLEATGQFCRLFVSYLVSVVLLVAVIAIIYAVVQAQQATSLDPLKASFIVAVFLSLVNALWILFAWKLTMFEKHYTWTTFRNHCVAKYFVFRMINTVALYLIRYLSIQVTNSCELAQIGDQFLIVMIVDLIVGNITELILSWAKATFHKIRSPPAQFGENTAVCEFDVAEEYLNLLYRQFIVYLGMSIFPFMPLLGIICHLADRRTDKFRLLKWNPQLYHLRGSMRKFMTFYLFFTALIAVVCWPFGAAWLLAKYDFAQCNA